MTVLRAAVSTGLAASAGVWCSALAAEPPPRLNAHEAVETVLAHMSALSCGEAHCAPASAEEIETPPVSDYEAEEIISRGILSGFGAACGLDWQRRNFEPLMAYWRRRHRDVRQMAIIGALHGVGQAAGAERAAGKGCDDQSRQDIDAELDFQF